MKEFHNCSRNINLLPNLDIYILIFCTLVLYLFGNLNFFEFPSQKMISLVKIGPIIWRTWLFKFINVIYTNIISSWKRKWPLIWITLNLLNLSPVCSELARWFWRNRRRYTNKQTDKRRASDNQNSSLELLKLRYILV